MSTWFNHKLMWLTLNLYNRSSTQAKCHKNGQFVLSILVVFSFCTHQQLKKQFGNENDNCFSFKQNNVF